MCIYTQGPKAEYMFMNNQAYVYMYWVKLDLIKLLKLKNVLQIYEYVRTVGRWLHIHMSRAFMNICYFYQFHLRFDLIL